MSKHTDTWKKHERRVARLLGGKRNGATGAATADVESDWLAVECKARKALPQWLENALLQAENAAGDEQLPIAVLHQVGRHSRNDIVCLRLSDFAEWFGDQDT